MSILVFADRYGIYEPEDLAFLRGIYDEIVAAPSARSDESAVAGELLYLFKSGVRDRELLYQAALRRNDPNQ